MRNFTEIHHPKNSLQRKMFAVSSKKIFENIHQQKNQIDNSVSDQLDKIW